MFFLARRWTGLRRAEVSSFFYARNAWPVSAHLSGNAATATQAGNSFAAAFAGVAFAFNGLTLNLLMWPSHIATLSWMPWVILGRRKRVARGRTKNHFCRVPRRHANARGRAGNYFTHLDFVAGAVDSTVRERRITTRSMFWRFPLVVALVIGLAAVQLLPFLDLAAHSQRSAGYADTRWVHARLGLGEFSRAAGLRPHLDRRRVLPIRSVMDIVLLSRHWRVVAGIAGRLDNAGGAKLR